MSFSRSGSTAPAFSFPIGVGSFTDVNASNAVFTSNMYSSFYRGDGGFLSNVTASIPSTFANLVVSNSVTTTNVFATIYRGDGGLLSNISGLVTVTGNTLSNLNASNLAFGVVSSTLIYGNTLSNLQFSNVSGFQSNTSSNLNASNLAFGVVSSTLIYGNTLSNLQFSNVTGLLPNTVSNLNASNLAFGVVSSTLIYGNTLSNLQFSNVTGLLPNTVSNLNASNLAFGVVSSTLIYGNTLSNINSSNLTQPFTNLVVSNTLTTTNLFANTLTLANASSTINVIGSVTASTFYGALAGSNTASFLNVYSANALTTTNIFAAGFTSNVSNTIFNYSTLTVPFVTATTLNVSSTSNLSYTYVTGNVGIQSSTASYPLDVGASASIPASGGETIRSYGPLIIGNGSNDNRRFISALDSSMAAGNSRFIAFGQAASPNNQGELKFVYAGAGSASNRVGIGLFSSEPVSILAGGVGIFTTAPTASLHVTGNVFVSNTVSTPNVLVTSNIGFSSATGTGGTATQLTSRNTGVTLNKPCGQITLFSSSILTQTTNTFTLTNSYVGANDLVLVNHISGQTPGSYTIAVNPNAGSADITMRNVNSATLAAGAPIIQFVVVKASIA